MSIFERFRNRSETPKSVSSFVPETPVLPFDVRYALSYREGQLGKTELAALTNVAPLRGWAFTMKALNANPRIQRYHIQQAVDFFQADPKISNGSILGSMTREAIADLPNGARVKAGKLAQLQRQGVEPWKVLYQEEANRVREEGATPALVTYATLIGLPAFVEAQQASGKPFLLLNPQWVATMENPLCGYVIRAGETAVDFLPKDFTRPEDAVIIDDVAKTGRHISQLQDFWRDATDKPAQTRVLSNVTTPL